MTIPRLLRFKEKYFLFIQELQNTDGNLTLIRRDITHEEEKSPLIIGVDHNTSQDCGLIMT